MMQEFHEFLEEYKIVGLAIAFILGVASTALVQSFVNNIVMPMISPLLPGGEWQKAVITVGPVTFGWGPFLAALINFIIIALVVFLVAKKIMKEKEKVTKK